MEQYSAQMEAQELARGVQLKRVAAIQSAQAVQAEVSPYMYLVLLPATPSMWRSNRAPVSTSLEMEKPRCVLFSSGPTIVTGIPPPRTKEPEVLF